MGPGSVHVPDSARVVTVQTPSGVPSPQAMSAVLNTPERMTVDLAPDPQARVIALKEARELLYPPRVQGAVDRPALGELITLAEWILTGETGEIPEPPLDF